MDAQASRRLSLTDRQLIPRCVLACENLVEFLRDTASLLGLALPIHGLPPPPGDDSVLLSPRALKAMIDGLASGGEDDGPLGEGRGGMGDAEVEDMLIEEDQDEVFMAVPLSLSGRDQSGFGTWGMSEDEGRGEDLEEEGQGRSDDAPIVVAFGKRKTGRIVVPSRAAGGP
jgi:hypothetical protein